MYNFRNQHRLKIYIILWHVIGSEFKVHIPIYLSFLKLLVYLKYKCSVYILYKCIYVDKKLIMDCLYALDADKSDEISVQF